MVLNRMRERIGPILEGIGRAFAATGISANVWTAVGLAVALAAAVVYGSLIEYSYTRVIGCHLIVPQRI